jgi:photosystem II stability/assembly factor-like uncharacterized protein
MIYRHRVTLALLSLVFTSAAFAADPKGGPEEFKHLKFRLIGPPAGGRVCRTCGVPGDPLTYYVASASGGVWKSADGGNTWKPIFDDQPVATIGSIAVAPSDPNVIYVGTGEGNIRGNVAVGNGIYKSTDAGKTWKQVWNQEGQIGTMIVHPTNPDIAFAAVLGHAFGPNEERGVYRTTDGGKTWKRVLSKDKDTGASDVCFDPANPKILFAGLWQARRRPWELTSGGPGSGLYRSDDGGDTWKQLTHKEEDDHWGKGLPEGVWGKVGIAVASSDSRRVYVLIEADKGGLYRSDDGGKTWEQASGHHALRQRAWYYSTLTIDPTNPDIIWCPQVRLLKSVDGGKTFKMVKHLHHPDHHDLWIDPKNPKRIIECNDGGVDLSTNGGESWWAPPLPLSQFYHVSVDNRTPYHVAGCMQDLGSAMGPSDSLTKGGVSLAEWYLVGGGEAGFTVSDPTDPNVVYAGEYGGYVSRFDLRTRQARNVTIYPFDNSGHGAEAMKYRFQWTAPILISPHDPKTIYHGGNVLFKSTDAGQHWTAISPDLTRNDKNKQKWSGGPITGDNTGAEYYCTIFALAESPKEKGLLWVGSDDGLVYVSRDGGKNWTNVTANIPNLPEWGTIDCIEPSPFETGTAYVVVDAHRLDDMKPYLYKTADYGKTWRSLTAKLPQDIHLHAVREDPLHKGILYLATERGVSFSRDDGATWEQLKINFPPVPVHDLVVKNNDLVIGTHGRSIWAFDDLTPIREWSPAIAKKEVHLFPPQPAKRWRYHGTMYPKGHGDNPPHGAVVNYFLKEKPKGEVVIEILDSQGNLVVKLDSKKDKGEEPEDDPDADDERTKKTVLGKEPGVNRAVWDLNYEGAKKIKKAKIDAGEPNVGPLANPGRYTVKLTVDGKTETAPLLIQPDPRVTVSAGDLDGQLKLALGIRDNITRLTDMVNQLRAVRKQLSDRNKLLKNDPKADALVKGSKELLKKLDDLEAKLHNPKAEVTYDILAQKGGAQLYSQLGVALEYLKDSDGPPTQGVQATATELFRELQQHETDFAVLLTGDLAKLNDAAKKLEIPGILVPKPNARGKKENEKVAK